MTALLLALASSFSYGASDFLTSRVAKRLTAALLVLYSQAAQGLVLLTVVLAVRQPWPNSGWPGAAAGALIAIGLVAYYQALAAGPPRWWPWRQRRRGPGAGRPGRRQVAGRAGGGRVVVVAAGIMVTTLAPAAGHQAAAPPCRGRCAPPRPGAWACPPTQVDPVGPAHSLAVRAFFLLVDRGSAAAGEGCSAGAWPPTRGAADRAAGGPAGGRSSRLEVRRAAVLLPVGGLTALNLAGDALVSYAVTGAELAVVGVLASLAPVVTVLLLRAFTAERLSWLQASGRCGRGRNPRCRSGPLGAGRWGPAARGWGWDCGTSDAKSVFPTFG